MYYYYGFIAVKFADVKQQFQEDLWFANDGTDFAFFNV